MTFERKMKRISDRNWESVKQLWLPNLPAISPVGANPPSPLIQTPNLMGELDLVQQTGERRALINDLYEPFFWHALFLLQKGSHVLTAAECHLDSGYISWANNSAYHSALFSAQAVLGFLGVYTVQYRNPYYIVNLFPGPAKGERNKKFRRGSEMQFMFIGRMDQRHWWRLFQEVVHKAEVQVWNQSVIDSLIDLDEGQFAIQRNWLIYREFGWGCGDLMQPNRCPHDLNGWTDIAPDQISVNRCDFTVSIAIFILNMGLRVLKSFEELTPILEPEIGQIRNQICGFGAPRAHQFLSSQGSI
jgi:hypothetical protein